ncbi:hypothetical protein A2U01_0020600, partial [Trifolium medium]|nr:hypothetical protein [Trifolium medium]
MLSTAIRFALGYPTFIAITGTPEAYLLTPSPRDRGRRNMQWGGRCGGTSFTACCGDSGSPEGLGGVPRCPG